MFTIRIFTTCCIVDNLVNLVTMLKLFRFTVLLGNIITHLALSFIACLFEDIVISFFTHLLWGRLAFLVVDVISYILGIDFLLKNTLLDGIRVAIILLNNFRYKVLELLAFLHQHRLASFLIHSPWGNLAALLGHQKAFLTIDVLFAFGHHGIAALGIFDNLLFLPTLTSFYHDAIRDTGWLINSFVGHSADLGSFCETFLFKSSFKNFLVDGLLNQVTGNILNSEALVFRNMFDHRLAIWSENILALLLNSCEASLLGVWFADL